MHKTCIKCGETKPIAEFKKDKRRPDGFGSQCKKCSAAYTRRYANEHREQIKQYRQAYYRQNKNKLNALRREYDASHREQTRERYARWKQKNKQAVKDYAQRYYRENKDKIIKRGLAYAAERRKVDPTFRNKARARARIRKLIKSRGGSMTKRTQAILGCDYETLWEYLLFTWEHNYGKPWNGEPYHIDHFEPLALAKTPEEVEKLCHYSNLQMLTPEDNIKKGDSLVWKYQ